MSFMILIVFYTKKTAINDGVASNCLSNDTFQIAILTYYSISSDNLQNFCFTMLIFGDYLHQIFNIVHQ